MASGSLSARCVELTLKPKLEGDRVEADGVGSLTLRSEISFRFARFGSFDSSFPLRLSSLPKSATSEVDRALNAEEAIAALERLRKRSVKDTPISSVSEITSTSKRV